MFTAIVFRIIFGPVWPMVGPVRTCFEWDQSGPVRFQYLLGSSRLAPLTDGSGPLNLGPAGPMSGSKWVVAWENREVKKIGLVYYVFIYLDHMWEYLGNLLFLI